MRRQDDGFVNAEFETHLGPQAWSQCKNRQVLKLNLINS